MEDHHWMERQRYMARMRQRRRREGKRRLDYYVGTQAGTIIDQLRRPYVGHDASSILNRIVSEWARDRNLPTS